jgi:hypothetical protein
LRWFSSLLLESTQFRRKSTCVIQLWSSQIILSDLYFLTQFPFDVNLQSNLLHFYSNRYLNFSTLTSSTYPTLTFDFLDLFYFDLWYVWLQPLNFSTSTSSTYRWGVYTKIIDIYCILFDFNLGNFQFQLLQILVEMFIPKLLIYTAFIEELYFESFSLHLVSQLDPFNCFKST